MGGTSSARRHVAAGVAIVLTMVTAPAGAEEPHRGQAPRAEAADGSTPAATLVAPEGVSPAGSGDLDAAWSGDGVSSVQTKYFPVVEGHSGGELAVAAYRDGDDGAFGLYNFGVNGLRDGGWGSHGFLLSSFTTESAHQSPEPISFPTNLLPYQGGQVVLGTYYHVGKARLGITRHHADGSLRTIGGYTGVTRYKVFPREHDDLYAFSADIYGNGMVMAAVAAFDFNSSGDLVYVGQGVLRVNGVGSLDKTFSGDGYLPVAKDVGDIAFRSDGGTYMGRKVGGSHEIRKFRPNGSLDPSFSGDGRALVPCGTGHVGADLEVDDAGRVLVTCVRYSRGEPDLRVIRMTTAGVRDPAYSGNGMAPLVLTEGDAQNWAYHVAPDGTVYAATVSTAHAYDLQIHSLDSQGEPNAAFSGDGYSEQTATRPLLLLGATGSGDHLFLAARRFEAGQPTVYVDLYAVSLT